eukprot:1885397-Amphidinium_carterae.1
MCSVVDKHNRSQQVRAGINSLTIGTQRKNPFQPKVVQFRNQNQLTTLAIWRVQTVFKGAWDTTPRD